MARFSLRPSLLMLVVAGIGLLGTWALYGHRPGREPSVRVAAAADVKFALEELIAEFQRQHPQITVRASYGSSGSLFAQLSQRAPFDIFFSADTTYPQRLIERGQALGETAFLYAVGRIVLWVPQSSALAVETEGIRSLLHPAVKKISLANPHHAPYGRAAEAALTSLGVYDAVREKLVYGENVAQAAQFVQVGAAQIGIIALSLALAPTLPGRFWEVPFESYPRLEQGGVLLSWARDRESTQLLREFVLSPPGRAILRRYGFLLPGE